MGNRSVIGELLHGGEVGSQAELARRAQVAKSTVSKAANGRGMGIKAAHKAGPPLGVDGDVLYGAVNLAGALKALEDGEASESETLERIGRIVRTLGERNADEEAEGMNEVLTAIEEALEELSGAAVESVRGEKPEAKTATKSAPIHASFKSVFDFVGTGQVRPEDYDNDLEDGTRDIWGRRLDTGNEPTDEDEYPTDAEPDGRNLYGQRTRPLNGQGR